MRIPGYGVVAAFIVALTAPVQAQQDRRNGHGDRDAAVPSVTEAVFEGLEWRSIGPANMSGRVTDVEGIPSPSRTFYVAAAAGGIWKTTNNGVTFRPLFQEERVVSLGDLAIAPSDTLQIWAGTGEEDSRNTISPGGGIYKSTDGGLTWTLMGLERTEHIGRIVVHPTDPDIVWVAATGALWRENPERGLYRTTDGGRTWRQVKHVSDRAGFVDLVIHPRDPEVLFATSWERIRGPHYMQSGGPGSALWKSTDGGETWTEVRGGGFPETLKGRIGIDIARSDPDVVYALVEAEAPDGEEGGCRAAKEGGCGLYRSDDGGRTWTWKAPQNVRPFYYSQVRVDPEDPDRVYWSSTPVNLSTDGGETVRTATLGIHVDHHAMWIDPEDPNRMIVGNDGGIGITFDRGGNYWFPNSYPIGQFYAVSYDMALPYSVCGGLQDNYTWCGPSRRSRGGIDNHMWFSISGGDGFVTAQDPRDPAVVYSESQGGNMGRSNLRTGERVTLTKPGFRDRYGMWEDSIALLHPDPATEIDESLQARVDEYRRSQVRDSLDDAYRYNWNTPFLLSPHDPDVFYAGASRVLRSTQRGDSLQPISPDLTKQDTAKIRVSTRTTGGITPDVTGAEMYGTIVSLAESPVRRGLLLAGTDDGNVWVTGDGGATWTDLTSRFDGLVPDSTYVSRIEPSSHDAGRFYVTFDNHRRGDHDPYVFVTDDGGRTFRSIAGGLPTGGPDFVHVIREDPVNPDLLFVGTDVGLYASPDRGRTWRRLRAGFPTVPVHDMRIHPRDRELIVATHGRSLWITDVAPLQQLTPRMADGRDPVLFEPAPGLQFGSPPSGGEFTGHAWFSGDNRPYGAEIAWYNPAPDTAGAAVDLVITDARGDMVQTLTGSGRPGLQRVRWNFRARPGRDDRELTPSERRDSLVTMQRADLVADSLIGEGYDSTAVRRVAHMLKGEEPAPARRGGGGGGRAAERSEWDERPGEGTIGGGRSGSSQWQLVRAFREAGIRGVPGAAIGGFGGSGAPDVVEPGSYTVTARIGGRTHTTRLEVVRQPE